MNLRFVHENLGNTTNFIDSISEVKLRSYVGRGTPEVFSVGAISAYLQSTDYNGYSVGGNVIYNCQIGFGPKTGLGKSIPEWQLIGQVEQDGAGDTSTSICVRRQGVVFVAPYRLMIPSGNIFMTASSKKVAGTNRLRLVVNVQLERYSTDLDLWARLNAGIYEW